MSAQVAIENPGPLRVWFQAIRFFSFTASTVPIFVASALAVVDHSFSWWLCLAMLGASIACHAGANLANDYFDHLKGIDTDESLGPSKVIQQGLLTPNDVRNGMVVSFLIAAALGMPIVLSAGWPVFLLALLSLGAAYFYTAGPRPLGYIALGEVTVFIFMGPVMVCGAYYVFSDSVTLEAILISIGIGLVVAAILHANNIRDIELDEAAGKVTLATHFGRRWANREYALLVYGTYVAIGVTVLIQWSFWPLLGVAITLPLAVNLVRTVSGGAGTVELNRVLRQTAGLHLRVGMLVTLGLLFRAVLDRVG